MSTEPTHAASPPHAAGQINRRPAAEAFNAADNTPETGCTAPFNDSSPRIRQSATLSSGNTPIATNKPTAIGRSKCAPSFRTSAGDRLTAILLDGSASPSDDNAARTRSLDSATDLSARPTIVIAGRPFVM